MIQELPLKALKVCEIERFTLKSHASSPINKHFLAIQDTPFILNRILIVRLFQVVASPSNFQLSSPYTQTARKIFSLAFVTDSNRGSTLSLIGWRFRAVSIFGNFITRQNKKIIEPIFALWFVFAPLSQNRCGPISYLHTNFQEWFFSSRQFSFWVP